MINFSGKVVLENNPSFNANEDYLESVIKDVGYARKEPDDFTDNTWYTML